MRFKMRITLILLFLLSSCSLFQTSKELEFGQKENLKKFNDTPTVLMISLDGYRYDYTDKYRPKNLMALRDNALHTKGLRPIFPSKTFPNHYALVTGMKAAKHGIVANRFYDPALHQKYTLGDASSISDTRWYGGRPIWIEACKQGMVSASYFWVGSEFEIDQCRPTYYFNYHQKTPKIDRVTKVIEWLQMPKEKRPRFLTLYFHDVDSAGHRFGPSSQQVKDAIMDVDLHLGILFDEIKKLDYKVNIIVVSDHGMRKLEAEKTLILDPRIKEMIDNGDIMMIGKGPHALLYFNDKTKINGARRILKKSKHITVYRPKDLPAKFGYSDNPRVGDLILEMEPGYYLYQKEGKKASGGSHGWDPYKDQQMQGIFYASGPNFKKGEIDTIDNIHLYPAIMKVLGLEVTSDIDGKLSVLQQYIK